jgi:hypothetical protein
MILKGPCLYLSVLFFVSEKIWQQSRYRTSLDIKMACICTRCHVVCDSNVEKAEFGKLKLK